MLLRLLGKILKAFDSAGINITTNLRKQAQLKKAFITVKKGRVREFAGEIISDPGDFKKQNIRNIFKFDDNLK